MLLPSLSHFPLHQKVWAVLPVEVKHPRKLHVSVQLYTPKH